MTRRDFLRRTSAGFAAAAILPGVWSCSAPDPEKSPGAFEPYRPGKTLGKVTCVTPDDGFYLHTFYDVCPWSPSERYLAVTKFPYQGRKPRLGDIADVCVIDLEEQTIEKIYATKAWSYQLGANLQWGNASDRFLYTNDIIDDQPVCVRIDRDNGEVKAFAGPKYDLAPDESYAIGGKLEYINAVQYGYGIPDGPSDQPNYFLPEEMPREGIWKTDLETNQTRLLVSFATLAEHLADREWYQGGVFYSFHTKVNRTNTRIMQVLRCLLPNRRGGRNNSLLTFNPDGGEIMQAMSRRAWRKRGRLTGSANHPNWHPGGDYIVMNAVPASLGYQEMMFCMFKYDGSDLQVLSEKHLGSGHPSVDPETKYLIADSYPKETWATRGNGDIPIRLIDLKTDKERIICGVPIDLAASRYDPDASRKGGSHFKLDPHPAWSRDYKKVCFNGAPGGVRRVFIADLAGVI